MFNIDGDGEPLISSDQPQTVKFVCFFIWKGWWLDGAFLVINPLLTKMGIFIDVDEETIVIEEIIWVKWNQHFIGWAGDIWWNIIATIARQHVKVFAAAIVSYQSVISFLQL